MATIIKKIIFFTIMLGLLSILTINCKIQILKMLCIPNTFNIRYILFILGFILGMIMQFFEYVVYTEVLQVYNILRYNFRMFIKIFFLSVNLLQIYIISNLYYLQEHDFDNYIDMLIIIFAMLTGRSILNSLFIMAYFL